MRRNILRFRYFQWEIKKRFNFYWGSDSSTFIFQYLVDMPQQWLIPLKFYDTATSNDTDATPAPAPAAGAAASTNRYMFKKPKTFKITITIATTTKIQNQWDLSISRK